MRDSLVTRHLFTRRWWVVVLRGVIAVIFGLMAFAWPHLTIATLVLLFGWYALIHGISSIFAAIGYRPEAGNRLLLALEGVVGIWAGIGRRQPQRWFLSSLFGSGRSLLEY